MSHDDISPAELELRIEQLRKSTCINTIDSGIEMLQRELMLIEKQQDEIYQREFFDLSKAKQLKKKKRSSLPNESSFVGKDKNTRNQDDKISQQNNKNGVIQYDCQDVFDQTDKMVLKLSQSSRSPVAVKETCQKTQPLLLETQTKVKKHLVSKRREPFMVQEDIKQILMKSLAPKDSVNSQKAFSVNMKSRKGLEYKSCISTAIDSVDNDHMVEQIQMPIMIKTTIQLSDVEEESKTPTFFGGSPNSSPSLDEIYELRQALKRTNAATVQRFKKGRKIPLLHPVDEKIDDVDSDDEIQYQQIGNSDIKLYKDSIKKSHKIFQERQIGAKTKSEFILSLRKLHSLIEDIIFVRMHQKEIKLLKKFKKQ